VSFSVGGWKAEGDETGQTRTNLHSSWVHGTSGTAHGSMELSSFPSIRTAPAAFVVGVVPAGKKVEGGVGCSWRRANMAVAILRLHYISRYMANEQTRSRAWQARLMTKKGRQAR
jgi:hypothetical protein